MSLPNPSIVAPGMQHLSILLIVTMLGCGHVPSEGNSEKPALSLVEVDVDALESTVSAAAADYFRDAPQSVGLSVGVIASGEIRTFHFGTTTPGLDQTPTDQTIYAIASITKTVAGSLLAQAELDGRLKLAADIRDYLDGTYPNLQFGGNPILVGHLLSHVSGLPRSLPDRPEMSHDHSSYGGEVLPWMEYTASVLSDYREVDFLRDLHSVRLDTIPGTRFSYSNAAAQLSGFILEGAYDLPFDLLMDSLLFSDLGMSSTTMNPNEGQRTRTANGFDNEGRQMPVDFTAAGAAGGLLSTIDDLSRYVRWHLDESDPVVRLSHLAQVGNMDHGQTSLGWYLNRSAEGIRRIGCDGNVPGFSSRVILYPELGIGVVVLANQLDWSIPALTERLSNVVLESLDSRAFTYEESI